MKKIFVLISLTTLLMILGCLDDSASRNQSHSQICASWIGHDVNSLIRAWGTPSSVYEMPNGNRIYTWNQAYSQTSPSMTIQRGQFSVTDPGSTTTYYCKTNFEVNPSGVIVFWRFEGNACN
jgi:hypothetical protein